MCMFTELVERVSDTSIFARGLGDRQLLVYSMAYQAKSSLAMVLPLPYLSGSGEGSVQFINLEDCPDFFGELRSGFETRHEDDIGGVLSDLDGDTETVVRKLRVHEVGGFEASFVPRPGDFGRLDERFRLPAEIWTELGQYRDWGFAVFKLSETRGAKVHPMALSFPRRDTQRLFFPTLHLHHRRLEAAAEFDHTLYLQADPPLHWHLSEWSDSMKRAREFVRCPEAARLLDLDFPCWQVHVDGIRENRDTWVGKGERLPEKA